MINSAPSDSNELDELSREISDACENERARLQRSFWEFRVELDEEVKESLQYLEETGAARCTKAQKINQFRYVLANEAQKYRIFLLDIEKR